MWVRRVIALLQDEAGQDLVEYALLMAFIALFAVAVLHNMGTSISTLWNSLSSSASDAIAALH
jgi:Flp pilus assembly pilin Flp